MDSNFEKVLKLISTVGCLPRIPLVVRVVLAPRVAGHVLALAPCTGYHWYRAQGALLNANLSFADLVDANPYFRARGVRWSDRLLHALKAHTERCSDDKTRLSFPDGRCAPLSCVHVTHASALMRARL